MKFCIIGNGAMGVSHLKALGNVPGMEVTAIQSRTADPLLRGALSRRTSPRFSGQVRGK